MADDLPDDEFAEAGIGSAAVKARVNRVRLSWPLVAAERLLEVLLLWAEKVAACAGPVGELAGVPGFTGGKVDRTTGGAVELDTSTVSPSSKSSKSANLIDIRTSPRTVPRLMCNTATCPRWPGPFRKVTSPRFFALKASASVGLIFTSSFGIPGSILTLSTAACTIEPLPPRGLPPGGRLCTTALGPSPGARGLLP